MKCTFGSLVVVRSLALVVVASLFAGCSGGSRLLPTAGSDGLAGPADAVHAGAVATAPFKVTKGRRIAVRIRIRIPKRQRHERVKHPATISGLTNSVGIAVDGGPQQSFNTTPTSAGCSIGAGGTVCTFAVLAAGGTDTFVVTTYSGVNLGGSALDRGVATVPVATGKANAVAVSLGPVVTTTADSGIGSLRYAVGSASSGDTIMFLLAAGSTIALATPITISGNVSLAGPGTAGPVTISGANAHQIFIVTGTATISGLSLTQGSAASASAPGGAINNIGTLTLANDTIGSSTSTVAGIRAPRPARAKRDPLLRLHPHCGATTTSEGGALYNDGTLTMSGTTFNGNVLQNSSCVNGQGGAIYNDTAGTLSSTGDTFTNNAAIAGGAVFNVGVGQVTFTGDTFTGNTGCTGANGCPTSGCTPTARCTSYAQGVGGAIYDNGSGITIASSTFTNNVTGGVSDSSNGEGGAIFLAAGTPTITGSTFTGNLAGGSTASCGVGAGGAIAATADSVVLNNDTFTGNQAISDDMSTGGAVGATNAIQGSNDTFNNNLVIASGSACAQNGIGIGGAFFGAGVVTVASSTFSGNSASANDQAGGGALGGVTCYVSGSTFTSNTVDANGTGTPSQEEAAGGALYAETAGKITGNTFTSNSATAQGNGSTSALGGGIVLSSGTLITGGNTFTSNRATETAGVGTVGGGGLVLANGTLISNGDTFANNSATGGSVAAGGGLFAIGGSSVTSAKVSGNTVAGGEAAGGGIALGASGQLSNVIATGNSATSTGPVGAGGAIYDEGGSTLNGVTIASNTANAQGGGIYATNPETIANSTISRNTVTEANGANDGGGGIYSTFPLDITGTTVANNTVTVSGTGTSGGGGIFNDGGLTMVQSTVSGNSVSGSAPASGGGGIFNMSLVDMLNDTVSGNSSSLDGGGVEIAANDMMSFANVTIFGNTATGAGGNIDNLFTIGLANSIVGGGTAATGADINNAGTITSGDYNIIQTLATGTPVAAAAHDKTANPLLLALTNNGGPTFTNADQPSSPGYQYIPYSSGQCATTTLATDQRGYTRGSNSKCDAGAFEYNGIATAGRHPSPKTTSQTHTSHGKSIFPKIHLTKFPTILE
jgi:hypothetical protein